MSGGHLVEAVGLTDLERARRDVAASYIPCLSPGVVIVDARALEELLRAAHAVTGGREQ